MLHPRQHEGVGFEVRLRGGRSLVVEPGFDAVHLRALLAVLDTPAEVAPSPTPRTNRFQQLSTPTAERTPQ